MYVFSKKRVHVFQKRRTCFQKKNFLNEMEEEQLFQTALFRKENRKRRIRNKAAKWGNNLSGLHVKSSAPW